MPEVTLDEFLETEKGRAVLGFNADVPEVTEASDTNSEDELPDVVDELLNRAGGRSKILMQRGKDRVRKAVAFMEKWKGPLHETLGDRIPSLLEVRSLKEKGLKRYLEQLRFQLDWPTFSRLAPRQGDAQLAQWMDRSFLQGFGAWRGEKLMAAIAVLMPQARCLGFTASPPGP
jgi:hypothetical protein